jgi:hypothetical protein
MFFFLLPLTICWEKKTQKMIRRVSLFQNYVRAQGLDESCVFASCILAMERGLLHVDATNRCGRTIGVVYVVDHDYFDSVLWHKYWEMGPDVATFWSAMPRHRHILSSQEKDILRNTPGLWADLALVQRFAEKNSWAKSEVHERIKTSLRFAWMAAVVLVLR